MVKKIDARQAMELEIEHMRTSLLVMKQQSEAGEYELMKIKMDAIDEDLKKKEEELGNMDALQQVLESCHQECLTQLVPSTLEEFSFLFGVKLKKRVFNFNLDNSIRPHIKF